MPKLRNVVSVSSGGGGPSTSVVVETQYHRYRLRLSIALTSDYVMECNFRKTYVVESLTVGEVKVMLVKGRR